jgi:flavin reductase (DIM6/NTAB) family NADH-FMN oxidoreductase RutF
MFLNLADNPELNAYAYFVGSITPRPIAWVSTLSEDGIPNIAPYSFFSVASCTPPVLSVTQINPRDKLNKDTLTNIDATKECVINIVSHELVEQMNASCANFPASVSEFTAVGIEQIPSSLVKPPGVFNAKVRYECELREIISISNEPGGGKVMLLNVKGVYINDAILESNTITPSKLNTVGKMGGDYFSQTNGLFTLQRP